jgi:lipopolysaccharide heptosyltransferase II
MLTPQKILIIRLSSLGDILLTTPIVRCLRKKFPHAQIDFLLKSEYAELYRFNNQINNLLEIKTGKRSELSLLQKQIQRTRYDILIDLQNNFRSRYLRFFSMARYTRVINKRVIKRYLLVRFGINLFRNKQHVVDRYFETIKKFGVVNDYQGLDINISGEAIEVINSIVGSKNLPNYTYVFGLAPSARHFTKRWLPDRFVQLGVYLVKKYHAKIFIFGSITEQEYCDDITQMINFKSGATVAENFAGKTNILETAKLLSLCDVVVTNDSGLMHLASALKKKIMAIFGSTVEQLGFFPYGTKSTVVEAEKVSCRPCSHIGKAECPQKHFNCMNEISVDEVAEAVRRILEK